MSAFCPSPALSRRGWLKVMLGTAVGIVAHKPSFSVQAAESDATNWIESSHHPRLETTRR